MKRHKFDKLIELVTYSTDRTNYVFMRSDGSLYVLEREKGKDDVYYEK